MDTGGRRDTFNVLIAQKQENEGTGAAVLQRRKTAGLRWKQKEKKR